MVKTHTNRKEHVSHFLETLTFLAIYFVAVAVVLIVMVGGD